MSFPPNRHTYDNNAGPFFARPAIIDASGSGMEVRGIEPLTS